MECAIFSPNKVLKHSKPGRKLDQFTYRSFPQKEFSTRISNLKEVKGGIQHKKAICYT